MIGLNTGKCSIAFLRRFSLTFDLATPRLPNRPLVVSSNQDMAKSRVKMLLLTSTLSLKLEHSPWRLSLERKDVVRS